MSKIKQIEELTGVDHLNKQYLKEDLAGFYASRRLLSFGNMITEKEDENIHKIMLAFMKKHEIVISNQELNSGVFKNPTEFSVNQAAIIIRALLKNCNIKYGYSVLNDAAISEAEKFIKNLQILSHVEIKVIKDGKPILLKPVEIKKVENDFYFERTGKMRPYQKKERSEIKEILRVELTRIINRIQDNGFSNAAARLIEDAIKELR